jgi:hypothetical protein
MRKSQETVLNEFFEKHGTKYDYRLVEYKGCNVNIQIICHHHGIFLQKPKKHKEGGGCRRCFNETIRVSKDDFIKRAMTIHGTKYDYAQIDYVNTTKKIDLICKKHQKLFSIAPEKHMKGQGCKTCGRENTVKIQIKGIERFIEEANLKHSKKYLYDQCVYSGAHKHMEIRCVKHGLFWQTPRNHLNGNGCPVCAPKRISKRGTE